MAGCSGQQRSRASSIAWEYFFIRLKVETRTSVFIAPVAFFSSRGRRRLKLRTGLGARRPLGPIGKGTGQSVLPHEDSVDLDQITAGTVPEAALKMNQRKLIVHHQR